MFFLVEIVPLRRQKEPGHHRAEQIPADLHRLKEGQAPQASTVLHSTTGCQRRETHPAQGKMVDKSFGNLRSSTVMWANKNCRCRILPRSEAPAILQTMTASCYAAATLLLHAQSKLPEIHWNAEGDWGWDGHHLSPAKP